MKKTAIGISDIGIYVPRPALEMTKLMEARTLSHPKLIKTLSRAVHKTGQISFRFPEPWEDTASLAGNSASVVLDRMPESDVATIRYLSVGTETSIDHAKPVASYVQGMLRNAGYPLNHSMATYEMKHACAGGTLALLSAASMLSYSEELHDRALAISSDIAHYDAPSTAEITQGAGAVTLMIEKNPELIELEMETQGLYSSDVDDFFRPLGSATAKVKGRYSMECYQVSLEQAFIDYCRRSDRSAADVLDTTDYVALHVPFAKMPAMALAKMLKSIAGKNENEIEQFFHKTRFKEALYLNKTFGNLYSGSLYVYLSALLHQEYKELGEKIVGRRIMIGSYGSGNTMLVFYGKIAVGAPKVIRNWDIAGLIGSARETCFDEYLHWLARCQDIGAWRNLLEGAKPHRGCFYLKDFSETGLRIYGRG